MPIPLGILAVAGAGAGAVGDFELLETTTLGSSASSVSFSSLNSYSAYKHLQLRMSVRNSSFSELGLRFNSVSTNSYHTHRTAGDGSTLYAEYRPSGGGLEDQIRVAFLGTGTNIFVPIVTDILDFNSSVKTKTTRSLSGQADSSNVIQLASGYWNSTNAITSITLTSSFATGSRFSLYGIK